MFYVAVTIVCIVCSKESRVLAAHCVLAGVGPVKGKAWQYIERPDMPASASSFATVLV